MERPREMSSSTGISEISESTDELDLVYRPKGLPRIRCQPNERIATCRDEDELCQLIEVLDRQSARIRGFQQQGKNNFTWKNPTMAAAPGVGMPTPVTLKQALRRSCISHASEAAAMKKLPRPTGLSDFAEAGKIKKLYATVICQNEKSLSDEKRNLLEINGVPEKESIVVSSKTRIELKKPAAASSKEELTPRKGHSCRSLEGKARAGGQKTREKGECSQSSKSSMGDRSSSTSISDDSNQSLSSGHGCKPHMSRDLRWTAIRLVEMNQGCIRLSNFKLLKRLGCGDIGTVYVAQLLGSSCLFALKVMDNDFLLSRKKMPRAQTEREILQILDHPFLPTLYAHFTADNLSCLVMEYCPGGDLHVLRQKQPLRSFPEPAARFYVAEVLLALEYLHMLGVIYRDLKPENILVREDGHIMLSDFDLSLRCSVLPVLLRSPPSAAADADDMPSAACADPLCRVSCLAVAGGGRSRDRADALPMMVAEPAEARSNSFVGTHEYLAPEIIKGEGHGSSVDWWTLGIFLYELLFGRTPFKGGRDEETLMNIVAQDLCFPESTAVTAQARDLIWGLLVKDPAGRLGAVRGATEIKRHPFFDGLNWALIRCTIPPETPTSDDIVLPPPPTTAPAPVPQPAVVGRKKTARCLNFGDEEVKFALF